MSPPRRIGDRFELDDAAPARGGMGAVHRGVDLHTGRRVALKLVDVKDGRTRARFATEWELLAQIRHPGIVEHVANGETEDGTLYMAMEWLEGEDLASRLGRGRLSLESTLALARQIAGALAEVHRHGVVHRDIKPANIFLPGLRAHAAKLLDFGVAKVEHRRMTGTGGLVGTPGYLAPEQARGNEEITPATDVFSLGLVIFECLTGLPAFSGSNPMALLVKVAVQPAPRLADERPDLPRAFSRLVDKMTARAPEDRFRDASALASALDYLDVEDTTSSRRSVLPARLTDAEQELLSVVIVGPLPDLPTSIEPADTLVRPGLELPDSVLALLDEVGAPARTLVDGSLLVTVRSGVGADAQAAIGARVAMALASARPERDVALATGRASKGARDAIGKVIERATALLAPTGEKRAPTRHALVDPFTAELLGDRIAVQESDDRLELVAERAGAPAEEGELVGRDKEIATLLAGWEDPGVRILAMQGDAGLGKTALLHAFACAVRERAPDARVLIARGDPVGAGRTFGGLEGLLRAGVGALPGDDASARREKLRARLTTRVEAEELPRVLAFNADLLGAPIEGDATADAQRAAAEDPSLRGQQIRRAWEDWLRAERRDGPVALIIDDAHFVDDASVTTLEAAVNKIEGTFGLIAGRELDARVGVSSLVLHPLPRPAAERLAADALGALASPPDVTRVVAGAGGNPLFLRELARAVLAGETSLPSSLVAIAQSRFTALRPQTRRMLRAASVFGLAAESLGLRRMLGADADAIMEVGGPALVAQGLLRLEGERYVFPSALVREAAYASLTPEDRSAGHGLAALWLSERGDVDPLVLVEHWSRSAHPELAAQSILEAAEMALAGNDFERVIDLAGRLEALGGEPALLGKAQYFLAEAHRWRGSTRDAVTAAERAIELLPERSDAWFSSLAIAIRMSASASMSDRVSALAERLLNVEVRPQDRLPMLTSLGRSTMAIVSLGYYDVAAVLSERLDELVRTVRSLEPYVGAWVYAARAAFAHHRQDLVEFRESLLESAECFAAVGNQRMEVVQRTNAGYALNEIGAPSVGQRELERALIVADELGLGRLAAAGRQNMAVSLMRQGRPEDAVEILRDAEYRFEQIGDRRFVGATRMYLAEAFRMLERLELARELAERAVEDLAVAPPLQASAMALLGQIHLDLGQPREGLRHASDAYEVFKTLGQLEEREELVLLVRAKALAACGEQEHASQAIRVASRRLEERAERIESAKWRERFLGGSPERVETMKLVREWP